MKSKNATEKTVTLSLTLTESQAWALAQMCKRFYYHHAVELSDGLNECNDIMDAIIRLQRALREKGWAPR